MTDVVIQNQHGELVTLFFAWFLDKGFLYVILILLHPYYQKNLGYILLYFRIDDVYYFKMM